MKKERLTKSEVKNFAFNMVYGQSFQPQKTTIHKVRMILSINHRTKHLSDDIKELEIRRIMREIKKLLKNY